MEQDQEERRERGGMRIKCLLCSYFNLFKIICPSVCKKAALNAVHMAVIWMNHGM